MALSTAWSATRFSRRVLSLHILELLGPGDLHAAILLAPAVLGLLRDAQCPANLANGTPAGQPDLGLAQHVDDLLQFESLSCHDRILRIVSESLSHKLDSI